MINFDKISLQWLDENYKRRKGLRNWTWKTIITGVITEHIKVIEMQSDGGEIENDHVHLLWHAFLRAAGVLDLDKVPKLKDPEHADVKAILVMYSLESFLFSRINQSSREQDTSAVETLGPFAVALTTIINKIESKRQDKRIGPFTCYSGMALPKSKVSQWEKQQVICLDGYRSTSMSKDVAANFALRGKQEDKQKVLLTIEFENQSSQFFISLNRPDYTLYLDEKEILLQAGLPAKVLEVSRTRDGEWTLFTLRISE